ATDPYPLVTNLVSALSRVLNMGWIGPGAAVRFSRSPLGRGPGMYILTQRRRDGRHAVESLRIDMDSLERDVGSEATEAELYGTLVRAICFAIAVRAAGALAGPGALRRSMQHLYQDRLSDGRVPEEVTFEEWLSRLETYEDSEGLSRRAIAVLVTG